MRCTHSNIWVELFWNSVVNTTKPLISSCVLFWKPKQSTFLFHNEPQYLQDMAPVAATILQREYKSRPLSLRIRLGGVLQISPHRDVGMWGVLGRRGRVLTFTRLEITTFLVAYAPIIESVRLQNIFRSTCAYNCCSATCFNFSKRSQSCAFCVLILSAVLSNVT